MQATRALGLSLKLARSVPATGRVGVPNVSRVLAARNALVPLYRTIQTQSLPPSAANEITNAQRMNRPSSPHFTIYQPQVTWIGSIFNRVTGAGLSVGMYAFFLAYLAAPAIGMPFDGASLVELASNLPEWAKLAVKAPLALAFSFHSWNGLRHLSWDSLKFLSLKGVYGSAYAVLAATTLSTIGLLMW